MAYIHKEYQNAEIYASTSIEYQTIKQYSNFHEMFPFVKEFVPAVDLNKNFKLLKNLKNKFPDIKIELMVNEGCLYACPLRYFHNNSIPYHFMKQLNIDIGFRAEYFVEICSRFSEKNSLFHLCNHNIIYPWEIEEYGNIGIHNFKLVGRNSEPSEMNRYIDLYLLYLLGIDDYKNIENEPIKNFNHYIRNQNFKYKVKDVIDLLPNIDYFKKHGHLCADDCGVECFYCYECAERIKKI